MISLLLCNSVFTSMHQIMTKCIEVCAYNMTFTCIAQVNVLVQYIYVSVSVGFIVQLLHSKCTVQVHLLYSMRLYISK